MKITLIIMLAIFCLHSNAQKLSRTPIEAVKSLFKTFLKSTESVDSDSNKNLMTTALIALQKSNKNNDISILIEVWMYYDPTDFPTRKLVEPIFYKDIIATTKAIEKRLKNKKKWESKETAPYSDLIELKEVLSQFPIE
jgi:hypothetical protein